VLRSFPNPGKFLDSRDGDQGTVNDSRPLYYSDEWDGRAGNREDGTARHRTRTDPQDENRHLAKVRVAGSNPVFRSKKMGRELGLCRLCPVTEPRELPITKVHAGRDRLGGCSTHFPRSELRPARFGRTNSGLSESLQIAEVNGTEMLGQPSRRRFGIATCHWAKRDATGRPHPLLP